MDVTNCGHSIDTSIKYSAKRLIKTKNQEIICNIFSMWISYFGPPKRFLDNNGGEFNDEGYKK